MAIFNIICIYDWALNGRSRIDSAFAQSGSLTISDIWLGWIGQPVKFEPYIRENLSICTWNDVHGCKSLEAPLLAAGSIHCELEKIWKKRDRKRLRLV